MNTECKAKLVTQPVKASQMTIIHQLIKAQSKPQTGVHFLKLEKAYLRCTQCRAYVLARTNKPASKPSSARPAEVARCHRPCGKAIPPMPW